MKLKSLGCAERQRRGPRSSRVRTFQLPVLCHHFSTPDLGACSAAQSTGTYSGGSIHPRNPAAAPEVPFTSIPDGRDHQSREGWWGMHHSSSMSQRAASLSCQHLGGQDQERWSLLSWQLKAEKGLDNRPSCVYF